MRRRKAIKAGMVRAVTFAGAATHLPLLANSGIGPVADKNMGVIELVKTLRAMEKHVCDAAAESIETSVSTGSPLFVHLRDARLSRSDISQLASALRKLSIDSDPTLDSFSVSYNTEIGNTGALALAQSLPHSLREVGLVDCNIGDEGGKALLQWAIKTPTLKLICVEQNLFSKQTKSQFHVFSQNNPGITVIV